MTQAQLDINIESEMHNAIFHDPGFVSHFLTGDSSTLDAVLAVCRQSHAYNADDEQWKLPRHISSEAVLYTPILEILETIKRSVDWVRNHTPRDDLGSSQTDLLSDPFPDDPDNVPIKPGFQDRHSRAVGSDEVETAGLKPDIVLFDEQGVEHWETVRMSIEIKKLPTYHKAAMKQLSRYARATFAHQLHRRHLFGLTICGTEATFVLFDRAGILYSPRIDMRSQFKEFTRAFASFLLLDRTAEGYDPAFDTKLNEEGRLKYYVDLPVSVFENPADPVAGAGSDPDPSSEGLTRKFEVVDRLCHRKSIRGRATIVLRLREAHDYYKSGTMETRSQAQEKAAQEEAQGEVQEKAQAKGKRKRDEAEEPQVKDYVLKIIWRDPGRDSEGEVMEHFKGMFGLAQHVWHSDAPGQCRCSPQVEGQCWASSCVASTAQWKKMEVCDNLRDIAIPVPMDDGNVETDFVEVDTTQHRPTSSTRKRRICSYILMSSIGVLLSEAYDPSEFMNAVLDAILGYWRLFNMGVLHRDISEGNVMIIDRENLEGAAGGETSGLEQRELPGPWLAAISVQEPLLLESEKMLQKCLARVRRCSTGMLSDFDLHAKHTLLKPWNGGHVTAEIPLDNIDKSTSAPIDSVSDSTPPESKRRRTNSRQSLPVSSKPSQTTTSRASTVRPQQASCAQNRQEGKIDFRTGTPAFMSIRISRLRLGTPYHHSYLDDLESFFWLIVWSAAAHLDDDSQQTSSTAQHILNSMGTGSLASIGAWKRSTLLECRGRGGHDMAETLQMCQNSWASDPIFTEVILGLGDLLHRVDMWEIPGDEPPASMFPRVVNVIMDALKIE